MITKSEAPTPVTTSLKVTVKATAVAAVGDGTAHTMEATVGGVLSMVYAGPVKLPLPAPPSGLPAKSKMVLLAIALSCKEPSPVPVVAVTV